MSALREANLARSRRDVAEAVLAGLAGEPFAAAHGPANEVADDLRRWAAPVVGDGDVGLIVRFDPGADACPHAAGVRPVLPSAPGCQECLQLGERWVHLRICLSCGHVGCCDDSPGRHARGHATDAGHVLTSLAAQ